MAEEEKVVNTAEATAAEAEVQVIPEVVPAPEPEKEQSIPKSRFDEINERLKQTEGTLNVAMRTIQNIQRPQPQTPEPETEYLDPAVKRLADENKQLKALGGALVDKMDLLEVQTNPDIKDYKKYASNVDQLRQQRGNQGQYISRLQAYYEIKGQEALRGGNRQPVVEKEPEAPEAIPQTRAAVRPSNQPRKPETLEQTIARLKDVPI